MKSRKIIPRNRTDMVPLYYVCDINKTDRVVYQGTNEECRDYAITANKSCGYTLYWYKNSYKVFKKN